MMPPENLSSQLPPQDADAPPAPHRLVVGVVSDLKNNEANLPADPEVFVPITQHAGEGWMGAPMFAVRTAGDPAALASAVRQVVMELDPQQPLAQVSPMTDLMGKSMAQSRFNTLLLGSFAGIALLLAAIGIYGVISYSVLVRTREIGLRLALGADRQTVLQMVLRESMRLSLVGLGSGLVLALLLSRSMTSLIFGIRTTDLGVYLGIALILMVAAFMATVLPARRAAAVQPMEALRTE